VDLNWDDFVKFYNLIYSIVALLENVIANLQIYYTFWILGLFIGKRKEYHWLGYIIIHQIVKCWVKKRKTIMNLIVL